MNDLAKQILAVRPLTEQLCVICDIDGTLADHSHRLHLVRDKPYNWPEFFRRMREDKPKLEVINTYHCLLAGLPAKGVLVSGRPESSRGATEHWLKINKIHYDELWMRIEGDNRPDEIMKATILQEIYALGYHPYLVLDDRTKVVEMWRKHGLTCLQVAQHDD